MSKKLLSEAQVRRFQSLASIKPINEMSSYSRDDELNEEEEKNRLLFIKEKEFIRRRSFCY